MQIRNWLFDIGLIKIHTYNIPIISVGNITAGGTGKTPFIIYLANFFKQKKMHIAVISRGYGRKTKGYQLVSDGQRFKGETEKHGDEPVLIARSLANVLVAVSEKRYVAIDDILKKYSIDLILLDDGFQHRYIARKVDLLLIRNTGLLKNKFVLPAGQLREFKFNKKRAQIIIDTSRERSRTSNDIFNCNFQPMQFIDINFKTFGKMSALQNKRCLAFAGIANPDSFKNSLKEQNIDIAEFISFRDHYAYNYSDLEVLINKCLIEKINYLICTEKDLVKICEIDHVEELLKNYDIKLIALRIGAILNNENAFFRKLNSLLD